MPSAALSVLAAAIVLALALTAGHAAPATPPGAKYLRGTETPGARPILETSRERAQPWRYTFEKPADNWTRPDFDDSDWQSGPGGFGTEGTPGAVVGTKWSTPDIWLRREFRAPAEKPASPAWLVHHDEDTEVYLNGVPAASFPGYVAAYTLYHAEPTALAALKPGNNLIAVHCHQTTGGQYVDVGLVAATAQNVPDLPADLKPLFDYPLRDPCVCLGPDGVYYLSGTTGAPTWWNTNEGIRLWKSADLKTWTPLGLVWTMEKDGTWQKKTVGGKRALWAPEIHFLKGTYWLTYCMNYGGTGLLKSTSGKAEGPYADVKPDGPLTGEIDASLFADDDGKVYFVYQDGKIARMKDDMTGLAETPRLLRPANADHVGFEGAFVFKANGRYYLSCAEFSNGCYDCMIASSDRLEGPYGERHLAIPHGGHNMFFADKRGQWWSTFFGSDAIAPFRERAGLLRVMIDAKGTIRPKE
jgi:xylan 1,4-beta-xylosidase